MKIKCPCQKQGYDLLLPVGPGSVGIRPESIHRDAGVTRYCRQNTFLNHQPNGI
jgi:hypothetical protein